MTSVSATSHSLQTRSLPVAPSDRTMCSVSNRGIDMKSLKLLLRFLTVGGLVLLLLIPLMMIRGVIQDRELYRAQAEQRVSQSMAGPQQVVGPLRVVPWREERVVNAVNENGKPEVRRDVKEGYLVQMPTSLMVDGACSRASGASGCTPSTSTSGKPR